MNNSNKTELSLQIKKILLELNAELEYLNSKIKFERIKNRDISKIEARIKNLEDKRKKLLEELIEEDFLKENINKVLLGDCVDYLKKLPSESIDLVVSDIPYGINLDAWDVFHDNTNSAFLGKSPAQENKAGFKRRGKPINGWNKEDREINKRYYEWVLSWSQYLFNTVKEGAPVFIFGGRRTLANAIVAMEESGFLLKDILAWEKSNAHHRSQDIFKVLVKRGTEYKINLEVYNFMNEKFDNSIEKDKALDQSFKKWSELRDYLYLVDKKNTRKFLYEILELSLNDVEIKKQVNLWKGWKLGNLAPYYEPIAFFMKPYNKYKTLTDNVVHNNVGALNMSIAKKDGKEIGNIISIDFSSDERKNKLHEAQKPLELIEFLIGLSTIKNQVVLDPFMGSGTTAIAAKKLERNFIGFELNEDYWKIADNRIDEFSNEMVKDIKQLKFT